MLWGYGISWLSAQTKDGQTSRSNGNYTVYILPEWLIITCRCKQELSVPNVTWVVIIDYQEYTKRSGNRIHIYVCMVNALKCCFSCVFSCVCGGGGGGGGMGRSDIVVVGLQRYTHAAPSPHDFQPSSSPRTFCR